MAQTIMNNNVGAGAGNSIDQKSQTLEGSAMDYLVNPKYHCWKECKHYDHWSEWEYFHSACGCIKKCICEKEGCNCRLRDCNCKKSSVYEVLTEWNSFQKGKEKLRESIDLQQTETHKFHDFVKYHDWKNDEDFGFCNQKSRNNFEELHHMYDILAEHCCEERKMRWRLLDYFDMKKMCNDFGVPYNMGTD